MGRPGSLSAAEGVCGTVAIWSARGPRDAIVERLRAAAAGDGPIEARTALVLSMTGPGNLLEVVAPERSTRKHARDRIDMRLDDSELEPVGKVVRRLIEEAVAVVASSGAFAGGGSRQLTARRTCNA